MGSCFYQISLEGRPLQNAMLTHARNTLCLSLFIGLCVPPKSLFVETLGGLFKHRCSKGVSLQNAKTVQTDIRWAGKCFTFLETHFVGSCLL